MYYIYGALMGIKVVGDEVVIPKKLFEKMIDAYVRMEQVLATLEILADRETLETIRKSRRKIAEGKYIEATINDVERVLKQ